MNAHERQPLLTLPEVRDGLREAIREVRKQRPFHVDAWVLLPDHMHCIWTLPPDDADFSARWSIIKRLTTRRVGALAQGDERSSPRRKAKRHGTLWQHRYWEHVIRDDEDYARHVDYIHWNPAKHGYVERVADWEWSTFHRYVRQGAYHVDWCSLNPDLELE
ncbi:MAG: transposase [Nevskia sp.]|nr:transposase [Nevskia sp.]